MPRPRLKLPASAKGLMPAPAPVAAKPPVMGPTKVEKFQEGYTQARARGAGRMQSYVAGKSKAREK